LKRSYEDLKQRSRQRVTEKLQRVIAAYDGSARNVREILRGLVAAIDLDLDVKAFVRELGKRTRQHHATEQKRGKLAS
jgi:hypothetical protein